MITKPKDVLAQKRIELKKKHIPYTSLGERQTMQVLHNLDHKWLLLWVAISELLFVCLLRLRKLARLHQKKIWKAQKNE